MGFTLFKKLFTPIMALDGQRHVFMRTSRLMHLIVTEPAEGERSFESSRAVMRRCAKPSCQAARMQCGVQMLHHARNHRIGRQRRFRRQSDSGTTFQIGG